MSRAPVPMATGTPAQPGSPWFSETAHSRRVSPRGSAVALGVEVAAAPAELLSAGVVVGTVAGMALIYLAPPLIAVFGSGSARVLGLFAWALMAMAFAPTLRLYRVTLLWGWALPAIALCYMLCTLDSALQFARGRGGSWKGRIQASRS